MLRACALHFKGTRDEQLPLIEFLYNNSYQASIRMTLMRACMVGGVVPHRIGMILLALVW